jgi:CheY-like chemotaxis protein
MRSAVPAPAWSVLLADYHDDTRAMYGEYLHREGCVVEQAADGREALAKAISGRYDLVILSPRLPGIDGYQLCELLRRDASTMATPVIIVTGDAMIADIERARSAGADATLVKPCLPEVLFAEVQRLVNRKDADANSENAMDGRTNGDGDASVAPAGEKRTILSRAHRRGPTTSPSLAPPRLRCPDCDTTLVYHHSNVGGVSARHPEQWDYFECPGECGMFEYRHRTRKLRRVQQNL